VLGANARDQGCRLSIAIFQRRACGALGCELKSRCCPKARARKVPRSIYEGSAGDGPRHRPKGEEGLTSRRKRKTIEVAATAQNLKRLAKLFPMPLPQPA
jgi:hypothetical protein